MADITVHVETENQPTKRSSRILELEGDATVKGVASTSMIGKAGGKLLEKEDSRDLSRDLYCFVLPVKKHGPYHSREDVDKFCQDLVNKLVAAGLNVTLFYSIQEDEIYIKVGATDGRLLQEADHAHYELELDPDAMKTIAESDKALPIRKPIHLVPPYDHDQRLEQRTLLNNWRELQDQEIEKYLRQQTTLSPFEQLHAKYDDEWEKYGKETFGVQIYKVYMNGSILRTADRMKLLKLIMERSTQHDLASKSRGAGLNLDELVLKGNCLAIFPLQNAVNSLESGEPTVDELFDKWNRLRKLPWDQPLDDIRDYFGEKIAFYFAFLGHYTKWLSVAAIIGLAIFIHQLVSLTQGTGEPNFFNAAKVVNVSSQPQIVIFTQVPEAGIYAIFVAFWATFMLEFWKRKQARLALKWGVSNFERTEVLRPEFIPSHYLPLPVSGLSEPFFSFRSFATKVTLSLIVVALCIGVVISAIVGIFVFKVFVSLPSSYNNTGIDEQTGTYIALVINAVVIMILGNVYRLIAKVLTDLENHRRDTKF